jgi:hypothetical protein
MIQIFECTIKLEDDITITEIISTTNALNIPTIVEERFGKKSLLLYTKPLF